MKIEFLLKLVSQREHAEMLLNGTLFMRPAVYYHKQEDKQCGQNDIGEAAVIPGVQMYKHERCPIYCMSIVTDADIEENRFVISTRCIEDFNCKTGYAVLIRYKEFAKRLPTLLCGNYTLDARPVKYQTITQGEMSKFIADDSLDNLFIKHPFFSYQKEYRIAIAQQLYKPYEKVVEKKCFDFQSDLRDIAKCYSIPSLLDNGKYYLHIEESRGDD